MNLRGYSIVTASYWAFTLTDGALRMLVLLHFHTIGYSPLELAFLFLLYEFFGVLTNLLGGWLGSRVGLKFTIYAGLLLQVLALMMLSFLKPEWVMWLSVAYVMTAQALSGVAKDLTKMSSKSAVKLFAPEGDSGLFKWVAILTGSKNALKGLGFLLGGVLLTYLGFVHALWLMAGVLGGVLIVSLFMLEGDIGKSKRRVKLTQLFSKSREINLLSSARFFLFASRDVWFVVALPVFLKASLGWSFNQIGSFMAAWVIAYGFVQAMSPAFVRKTDHKRAALVWVILLCAVTAALATSIHFDFHPVASIIIGLSIFGIVFAINSSLHSYLILAFTNEDEVALNVGFYYMANALGRLVGTLLSGLVFMYGGLSACLWTSAAMLLMASLFTFILKGIKAT